MGIVALVMYEGKVESKKGKFFGQVILENQNFVAIEFRTIDKSLGCDSRLSFGLDVGKRSSNIEAVKTVGVITF